MNERVDSSVYHNLFAELWLHDAEEFRRYLRVNTESYEVSSSCYYYRINLSRFYSTNTILSQALILTFL